MSDKYERARVLGTGASTSGYLKDRPLSQIKSVAAQRDKRLLSDEVAEKHNSATNASRRRRKAKELAEKFSSSNISRVQRRIVDRVRHHISRGRDVSDIAIREMVMVSDVQRIVDAIKQEESK